MREAAGAPNERPGTAVDAWGPSLSSYIEEAARRDQPSRFPEHLRELESVRKKEETTNLKSRTTEPEKGFRSYLPGMTAVSAERGRGVEVSMTACLSRVRREYHDSVPIYVRRESNSTRAHSIKEGSNNRRNISPHTHHNKHHKTHTHTTNEHVRQNTPSPSVCQANRVNQPTR